MLERLCVGEIIEKTRYFYRIDGLEWTVDAFHGANAPLLVAEIELDSAGMELDIPPWIAEEISSDPRYFNANLALCPYSLWADNAISKCQP
jgi:CYTH domain-containing protein